MMNALLLIAAALSVLTVLIVTVGVVLGLSRRR